MGPDAFAKAIQSEELRRLFQHWLDARDGRRMPGWSAIRPSSIRSVLPIVWAWKYDRDTDRFTGRLVGDQIHEVFGASNAGRPLEECFPPYYHGVIAPLFKRVVATPALYRSQGQVYAHLGSACTGERIALPLAEDGQNGDGIIGATRFDLRRRASDVALAGESEEWFSVE